MTIFQWLFTIFAFAGLLILPGWLLSLPLPYRWYECLPLSLVLGVGLLSPFAVLLLQLRSNIHLFGAIALGIIILLGVWQKVWRYKWQMTDWSRLRPTAGAMVLALATLFVIALFLTFASTFSFGDGWFYLAYLRQYIEVGLMPELDVLVNTPSSLATTTRAGFNGWWVIQALLVKWSGADLLGWYIYGMPALLMPTAILAHLGLAKKLMGGVNAGIFATLLYLAFILASFTSHDWVGQGFLMRISEDKFLVWLIFLPVASRLWLDYLDNDDPKYVRPLLVCAVAFAFTHPLGLVQWGIVLVGMVAMRLLFPSKGQNNRRLWLVLGAFGLLLIVPLAQRILLADGDAVGRVSGFLAHKPIQQGQIFLFSAVDNHYISHPALLAHPYIILSLLLTPFFMEIPS